jgi:hypothetical protein
MLEFYCKKGIKKPPFSNWYAFNDSKIKETAQMFSIATSVVDFTVDEFLKLYLEFTYMIDNTILFCFNF